MAISAHLISSISEEEQQAFQLLVGVILTCVSSRTINTAHVAKHHTL